MKNEIIETLWSFNIKEAALNESAKQMFTKAYEWGGREFLEFVLSNPESYSMTTIQSMLATAIKTNDRIGLCRLIDLAHIGGLYDAWRILK